MNFFRFFINDQLLLVVFDKNIKIVEPNKVDDFILFTLLKSYSIVDYDLYKFGLYNIHEEYIYYARGIIVSILNS